MTDSTVVAVFDGAFINVLSSSGKSCMNASVQHKYAFDPRACVPQTLLTLGPRQWKYSEYHERIDRLEKNGYMHGGRQARLEEFIDQ